MLLGRISKFRIHIQCIQSQLGIVAVTHCPADNFTALESVLLSV
jgi:hypothetical protein